MILKKEGKDIRTGLEKTIKDLSVKPKLSREQKKFIDGVCRRSHFYEW